MLLVNRQLRAFAIIAVVIFFVVLLSLRGLSGAYTDYLWFDSMALEGVWSRILLAKVVLAAVFIAIFFSILWLNLYLAERMAPSFRPEGPEEEVLSRFHDAVGGRYGLLRFVVAALFAISAGAGASAQWRNWILFRNRVDFGEVDALFGRDIGFYVFELPFLSFVTDWLFTALVIVIIVTAAAHYLNGGIRVQTQGQRATPQVKAHMSVLLALLALVRTGDYWLGRFELTTSTNGTVDGATFADVNARLPVFNLLILISLFACGLLLFNILRRGWVLPAIAVGLWAFVSTVMGGIYPFAVQRFSVEPSESTKEAEFIVENIGATRDAFGLAVERRDFAYDGILTADDIVANADVLETVPLLDPGVVGDVFNLNEAGREFFRFNDVIDVDRYEIDGEVTPVVLGARGLNLDGVPQTWESTTLSFTHGNGIAMAPANTTDDQLPVFVIGDIPPRNEVDDDITLDRPQIYHGEFMDGYAIVNSGRDEVDYIDPATNEQVPYRYTGEGGVPMGGLLRQLAFSLRFNSIDPLISDLVTDESKVIYIRNVRDRLKTVAPFLSFDSDPYPVIADGGINYVVDGYTTSSRYPYSQRADRELLPRSNDLPGRFNYIRNSVKAVVDAYDGTVTLYIVEPNDPIIRAYEQAFPELFAPISAMSPEVAEHLRYASDMFTVQTNMWGPYQVDKPVDFYDRSQTWSISPDPGGVEGTRTNTTTGADGFSQISREQRVSSYYTYTRLPAEGEDAKTEAEFVALRSFVAESRDDSLKKLTALVMGVSDVQADGFGQLVEYAMPGTEVDGPALVASQISSQEDVSKAISLLDAAGEGTEVVLEDLLIVPIENSLLYVRPLYVKPTGTKLPALEKVIVSHAGDVVMCAGFAEAIDALFGVWLDGIQSGDNVNQPCEGDIGNVVPQGATGRNPSGNSSGQASSISPEDTDAVVEALALLDQAQDALLEGDLGRYQQLVEDAKNKLEASNAADADAEGEAA